MKPTNPGDFQLPPDVSFRKQRLNDGWAYVFRHRTLGELGRILIQDTGDGHSPDLRPPFNNPGSPPELLAQCRVIESKSCARRGFVLRVCIRKADEA